jgi:glucokinase
MIVHSLDIGGSSIKSGIMRVAGNWAVPLGPVRSIPVMTRSFSAYKQAVLSEIASGQASRPAPVAVAISTTGQLSADGTVLNSGLIQGYTGVSWSRVLAGSFGRLPITIVTDGQASALAEYYANGAKDPHVHAVIGTGVGGGIVSGGEPVPLAEEAGGRFGHIKVAAGSELPCSCGSRGCCETLAAAAAIVRLGNSEAPAAEGPLTLRQIAEKARAGDQLALGAFEGSGYWLGAALGTVMRTLTPACITIGGGVILASQLAGPGQADPYLAGVKRGLRAACPDQAARAIPVRSGKLANDAGVIGAAILARKHAT